MQALWNTVFYQPIYNILIFTINTITWGDVGFAVIIMTIIVKLILAPLTQKSIKSQLLMKRMEPELKRIKKEYPNKEEQAKKTFEMYKKYGTNPFSGCLVVLIQLPIIFTLYYVFYRGLSLGTGPLYPFIHAPLALHTEFLGLFDVNSKSIILAVLAGLTQFTQGYLATPRKPKVEVVKEMPTPSEPKSFQEELSSSMQMNVRYILPVLVAFIAYKVSAVVALYLITSNLFTIVQEWYIRRKMATHVIE
jgi:YidC/Oxa1 family membrane protein insertase